MYVLWSIIKFFKTKFQHTHTHTQAFAINIQEFWICLEIFYSRLTAYVPRKEMKCKNRILDLLPISPSSLLHLFIHSFIHSPFLWHVTTIEYSGCLPNLTSLYPYPCLRLTMKEIETIWPFYSIPLVQVKGLNAWVWGLMVLLRFSASSIGQIHSCSLNNRIHE